VKPRIFFVDSGNGTFVKIDREILREFADVDDFVASYKFPYMFGRYWQGVKKADIVFCWFASWNSLWALVFAKLLRTPSILVIGGYDLANLPDIKYGHQRCGLGKWVSRSAMKLATRLFTNSYFSKKEAEHKARILRQRVQVIYYGIPGPFESVRRSPKDQIVLTVGRVDWPNLKRKGLELFVTTAKLLPDMKFVLVGEWADNSIDHLRSIASANVILTGRISDKELLDYYLRASVYIQASLHEGFGLSVAEAMLAECVPVVTRNGSLPEVVGECGVYCESNSPESIAQSVRIALQLPSVERMQIRQRILTKFPVEERKKLLTQIIEDLIKND